RLARRAGRGDAEGDGPAERLPPGRWIQRVEEERRADGGEAEEGRRQGLRARLRRAASRTRKAFRGSSPAPAGAASGRVSSRTARRRARRRWACCPSASRAASRSPRSRARGWLPAALARTQESRNRAAASW